MKSMSEVAMLVPEMDQDAVGYAADHPAVVACVHALTLGRTSWEAGRDECLAWLRVRSLFDPGASSNTGHKYIYWNAPRRGDNPTYKLSLWVDGARKLAYMAAPPTLEEARTGPLLEAAIRRRDQFPIPKSINKGMGPQFAAVLAATEQGRAYLQSNKSAASTVMHKAAAGAAYGDDGWSEQTSITAHLLLVAQPDRRELVADGITVADAIALIARRAEEKRAKLKQVTAPRAARRSYLSVEDLPRATSKGLLAAMKAGVTLEQITHAWGTLLDARVSGDGRLEAA